MKCPLLMAALLSNSELARTSLDIETTSANCMDSDCMWFISENLNSNNSEGYIESKKCAIVKISESISDINSILP